MPGFLVGGDIKSMDNPEVVFTVKSSSGKELKTYTVPRDSSHTFEASIKSEMDTLRKEAGENDPLMLIKIERCF